MGVELISAIGLPILMFVGGIMAWRMSKRQNSFVEAPKETWRDDSLDDWRRERDAEIERERQSREAALTGETHISTGKAEEQATEKKQQRIGG